MKIIKLKKVEKDSFNIYYKDVSFDKEYILQITTEESDDDTILIKGELYCGKKHDRNITIACSLDDAREKLNNLIKTYTDIGYEIVKEDEEKSSTLSLEDVLEGNF